MEAVSASPVTALMNDVSRQHEKRKEDFDPDPEWIKALQVRINDEKKTMRTQARKDFEAKLGEVDPIDQAAEERLEAEYSASLAAIDRLLIQEYEREVATERAQRMILAGLEDDPAVKAVIEQQAAILAAIQKGDKQGDASLESTASLSRGRAPIDIDAAGPSTEYNPTRRSRPSQASIRNNRDESGPLPDPSIFADSPRPLDAGHDGRKGKRRSSSSSTRTSALGQEFWRPPPGAEEQSIPPRTSSQQSIGAAGVNRRDSVNSIGRSKRSPYVTMPPTSSSEGLESSDTAQKEREAVDAAEGQWAELNRRNQGYMGTDVHANRFSGIRADSRYTTSPASMGGLPASPHVAGPSPNDVAPSTSSKRVVNKPSSMSEDPRNGPQINPIYGPQPRVPADYDSARLDRSGSFEDRQSISRPSNPVAQPVYGAPVDKAGASFQSGVSATRPLSTKTSFSLDNVSTPASSRTMNFATHSASPQDSRFNFPVSGSPGSDMAGSWQHRSSLRSQPSLTRVRATGDEAGRHFPGSKPFPRPRPTASMDSLYESHTGLYNLDYGSSQYVDELPFPDRPPSPPYDYRSSYKPRSIRSRSSLRDVRYPSHDLPPWDDDAELSEEYEDEDDAYQGVAALEMHVKRAEASRIAEADRLRRAELILEAAREEVEAVREEAERKAEAARREAARASEEAERKLRAAELKLQAARKDAERKLEAARRDAERRLEAERQDAERRLEAERQEAERKLEAERKAEADRKAEAERRAQAERIEQDALLAAELADVERKAEEVRRQEAAARYREQEVRKREEELRRREEELKRKEREMQLEEQRLHEEKIRLVAERKRQDSMGSEAGSPWASASSTSTPWSGLNRNGSIGSNAGDRTSKSSSSTWSSTTSSTASTSSNTTNATSTSNTSWTSSSSAQRPASTATPGKSPSNTSNTATPPPSGWNNPSTSKPANQQPGSSPHSASVFDEDEWARRQEEQAKKQQEAFKREQERLENERQAKMSRTLTKEQVVELFAFHERQWNIITSTNVLEWNSFPWPMFKRPKEPEELTTVAISAYVLSPHYPSDKSSKDRIKEHIRRWHPDRFETKLLPKVKEEDQEKVKEGAGVVARGLNELLTRSNINNAFA